MKIDANNAAQYLRHCKNLAIICGKEEHEGQAIYAKLLKLEREAHQLQEYECNMGELTGPQQRKEARIRRTVEDMILPQYRDNFFINGDPRGYTLKLHTPAQQRDHGKTPTFAELPEGFYSDWGQDGILAPEF